MAQRRLSMRSVHEVLRLRYELKCSLREIAVAVGISLSTVSGYLRRAEAAGISWPLPEEMDDAALTAALFPPKAAAARPEPDWADIHRQLTGKRDERGKGKRVKGMTLQTLWLEYLESNPGGYRYSRFCDLYKQWRGRVDVVMRQNYRAGEKVFVDYAGPTFEVVDRSTGEVLEVMVFVGVLAASNYTFVDVSRSRSLPDWTMSHVRMFEYFGGAPELVICDNEKAAVTKASRYEPVINRTYQEMAAHYGAGVLAAGPAKPRWKAKAEVGVQIVERQIMAPLRNHTFFSLDELRAAVMPRLAKLNGKPFQKLPGCRRSWFEELDLPALRPLPGQRYEYAEWRKATVNIDYHIQADYRLYSVPHSLARKKVDVRMTAHTVEVFFNGRRVAAHQRLSRRGAYATDREHMPAAHRAHAEWRPSRLIRWAGTIGPDTAAFVKELLESRPHPEHGYRSCLGLMSLCRIYPNGRIEAACRRALRIRTLSYSSVKSILASGLDRADDEQHELDLPTDHAHIRGPDYYTDDNHREEKRHRC